MKLNSVDAMLPDTVRLIASLVGLPRTLRLVEELGGTTFQISKNITRLGEIRYSVLAEVVGVEAADVLTKHFGGDTIYIPRCADGLRYLRNRTIVEEFDRESATVGANAAVNALALRYKLSDRRIWEILKKTDCTQPKQTALF